MSTSQVHVKFVYKQIIEKRFDYYVIERNKVKMKNEFYALNSNKYKKIYESNKTIIKQ